METKDIASALGVSEGAVSQWLKRGRAEGLKALKAHPPKGVQPRLSVEQKVQIPALLAKGAEAYGFIMLGLSMSPCENITPAQSALLP